MTQLDLMLAPTPPESAVATVRATGARSACGQCGKSLTGRQRQFCSDRCRNRYWDQQNPRINRGPAGPREGTILHAMLEVLKPGAWMTTLEIADAVRAREHSVSARISEARARGYDIESDAVVGNTRRAHRFRLVGA